MKRSLSLAGALITGFAAIICTSAEAECSRRIVSAYTTPLAAEIFGARPESGIPSMTDEIATLTGCPIELVWVPTARVWALFSRGDIDLVLGAIQTDDRDQVADFIPSMRIPMMLVTLKPPGSIPDHLEEFAGHHLRVGLLRGIRLSADAQAVVDDLRRQGLIDEATDREEAYRKLEAGRDDAMVATAPPTDRPERDTLRVIVQSQFSPLINGTYLRRAPFTPAERQVLHEAIIKATSDRDVSAALR